MHPIHRNIVFKLPLTKVILLIIFMQIYKSKYILRNFTNIVYSHFSSSSIDTNQNRYPYLFGGIASNPTNQQDHKYSQLIQSFFDGKFPELDINSYRSLHSSLENNNVIQLNNMLQNNFLNSYTSKPVKQINKDAQINYKICGSKCIIGIGSNRKIHELSMMRLGYFQESNFGLYYSPSKEFNQKKLSCLFQAKILYQSRLKLISASSNQPESNIVQQQQSHIVQYEIEGNFSSQSTNIAQQFNKYKQKLSWFDMIGAKSKQLGIQFVIDLFGLKKDAINWKVSDLDNYMNGNHPKIYPEQAKL